MQPLGHGQTVQELAGRWGFMQAPGTSQPSGSCPLPLGPRASGKSRASAPAPQDTCLCVAMVGAAAWMPLAGRRVSPWKAQTNPWALRLASYSWEGVWLCLRVRVQTHLLLRAGSAPGAALGPRSGGFAGMWIQDETRRYHRLCSLYLLGCFLRADFLACSEAIVRGRHAPPSPGTGQPGGGWEVTPLFEKSPALDGRGGKTARCYVANAVLSAVPYIEAGGRRTHGSVGTRGASPLRALRPGSWV